MAQQPKNQYRNGAGATVTPPAFKDQYQGPLDAKNTGRVATAYNTNIDGAQPDMGKQFTHSDQILAAITYERAKMQFIKRGSKYTIAANTGTTIEREIHYPILSELNVSTFGLNNKGEAAQGNFYGESDSYADVYEKAPHRNEFGDKANRYTLTRATIHSVASAYGVFTDYTDDTKNYDDAYVPQYIANETGELVLCLYEDRLYCDIVNHAGIFLLSGSATGFNEMSPASAYTDAEGVAHNRTPDVVTYNTLVKFEAMLKKNKVKPVRSMGFGSQNFGSTGVQPAHYMYIHQDLERVFMEMLDNQGNLAFKHPYEYGMNRTVLEGEIGQIGKFVFISAERAKVMRGVGAVIAEGESQWAHSESNVQGDAADTQRYDVYDCLVIGEDAFSTLALVGASGHGNFDTTLHDAKSLVTRDQVFESTHMLVTEWTYGTLFNRPERIAVIKTVCPAM